MKFKWICPFCNQGAIITGSNFHKKYTIFSNIVGENKIVISEFIECPNPDCDQFLFAISLYKDRLPDSSLAAQQRLGDLIKQWVLIPISKAKVFPSYIPKPIIEDYTEACLIKDLSPKASATLARRCLQGMIRDFWKIKEDRLIDEIKALKDKVDLNTWGAIDSVRGVGNIGAHMEKDINLIIDVDPNEAELLINLIEILIKDWYINRYEREEKLKAIKKLGEQKKAEKKSSKKGEG
ncbi:MAG: DUF4145 domain-containing protein [Candidatus Aminicenantes bacterium]|nr:DUF4145 domain-containing protein [Candidatus Aminicenantes bacterium]